MAVVGVLGLAFPGAGYFPFPWTELVMIELPVPGGRQPLVRTTPAVRVAVGVYAVASLASFMSPTRSAATPVGWPRAIGIPLLACFVTAPEPSAGTCRSPAGSPARSPFADRRWQRYAGVVLVPFAVWQWAPGVNAVTASHGDPPPGRPFTHRCSHASRPAARSRSASRSSRPPSTGRRRSSPPTLSLARGLGAPDRHRPQPALLPARPAHAGDLPAVAGRQRRRLGGPPRRLRSTTPASRRPPWWPPGRCRTCPSSGRRPRGGCGGSSTARAWSPGPARLRSLAPDHLSLLATGTGDVTVRVRWTSYWAFSAGTGCLAGLPTGWTRVHLTRPGPVELSAALGPERGPYCPTP